MEAQAYQVAKGIFLVAPPMMGDIDAIILTGGLANNQFLVDNARKYIACLAPVVVLPGEFEMEALALGGLRILRGQEPVSEM